MIDEVFFTLLWLPFPFRDINIIQIKGKQDSSSNAPTSFHSQDPPSGVAMRKAT